jgi:DNA-binding NarL/FixJ family response regulator
MALTLRELEVLRGIAEARRNSEIAQELFISTRTVEKHVENILRKLGVKRRMHAAQHFQVSSPTAEKAAVATTSQQT